MLQLPGRQVSRLIRAELVHLMHEWQVPKLERVLELMPIVLERAVPKLERAELVPIVLERAVPKLERAELMSIVLERPDLC